MKRKLSDLKDNECIKVNTLKEIKWVIKNINKTWVARELLNGLVQKSNGVFFLLINPSIGDFEKAIPASDFIKPKKSKLKKVWQEIARMDGRIADLEADKTKPDLFLGLECGAEIIQEKEIDWGISGQLVEYKTGAIWMTTGNHTEKEFEGILIVSKRSKSKRGEKFFGLNKVDFNLSKKEILLKNY